VLLVAGLAVVGLAVLAFWIASGLSIEEVTKDVDPGKGAGAQSGDDPVATHRVVTAKLTLLTEPKGAEVFRKGTAASLGKTPLDLRLADIGKEVEFVFRLPGYQDASEKVLVADNTVVSIALERRDATPVVVQPTPVGKQPKPIVIRTKKTVRGKKTPTKVDTPDPGETQPTPKTKKPTKINPEDVVDPFVK
jgi:hypothetical protein